MLKATSAPTVSSPSITAFAPKSRIAAVVSLLTNWMLIWPPVPSIVAAKLVRT